MAVQTKSAPVTLGDFPKRKHKLELVCARCGASGTYMVGCIFLDPEAVPSPESRNLGGGGISFSAYFRCRQCNCSGPWEFPAATEWKLSQMIQSPSKDSEIVLARFELFDGTFCRSPAHGEDYLRELIAVTPHYYFLWSRLGNLYEHAGLVKESQEAFEKAVELNPRDVDSHYSIGCYWMGKNDRRAAEHLHQVVRCARLDHHTNRVLLEAMVRDTLERLVDLNYKSDGAIPMWPEPDTSEEEPAGPSDTVVLALETFDLSTEQSWQRLTHIVLGDPVRPGAATRVFRPQRRNTPTLPSRQPALLGGNAVCPCGSGRKFKHCCGRR
jgi:hypothetical protein